MQGPDGKGTEKLCRSGPSLCESCLCGPCVSGPCLYLLHSCLDAFKGLLNENKLCLFYILFENQKVDVKRFLVVSEPPELYRKLREACRKKLPHISSKSALVTLLSNGFKGLFTAV